MKTVAALVCLAVGMDSDPAEILPELLHRATHVIRQTPPTFLHAVDGVLHVRLDRAIPAGA